eukprot:9100314-Pyramimonas_sp.AAC.2
MFYLESSGMSKPSAPQVLAMCDGSGATTEMVSPSACTPVTHSQNSSPRVPHFRPIAVNYIHSLHYITVHYVILHEEWLHWVGANLL